MWKRSFWLAYLLLVTFMAFLLADIVNAFMRAKLSAPLVAASTQASSGPHRAVAPATTDYDIIIKRNIFNAHPPATSAASPPVQSQPVLPPTQATQLQIRLVGTVTGAHAQRYAIIEDLRKRGTQALYQVGDAVQGALITDIRPDCVVLDVHGQYQSLCFQYDQSPAHPRKTARPSPRPSTAQRIDRSGIYRIDAATWRVSRELIMEQFANLGNLSTQAQMLPYVVRGQTQGFRLVRLKPGSLLQRLGLRNGDVIQKVNGLGLNSPDEALLAYQQLQNESTIRLEVLRRNRPLTLTYELR